MCWLAASSRSVGGVALRKLDRQRQLRGDVSWWLLDDGALLTIDGGAKTKTRILFRFDDWMPFISLSLDIVLWRTIVCQDRLRTNIGEALERDYLSINAQRKAASTLAGYMKDMDMETLIGFADSATDETWAPFLAKEQIGACRNRLFSFEKRRCVAYLKILCN
jgi:hypothetical protein